MKVSRELLRVPTRIAQSFASTSAKGTLTKRTLRSQE